jgi:hypothetical protein
MPTQVDAPTRCLAACRRPPPCGEPRLGVPLPQSCRRPTRAPHVCVHCVHPPCALLTGLPPFPGTIETYLGDPPDGKKTCIVDISKEDFVTVYRGASLSEVGKMCLSGRIYVRRFNFRELQVCWRRWRGCGCGCRGARVPLVNHHGDSQ